MTRFRNRLVNLHWRVEDRRVYDYLQTVLPDLDCFARAIAWRDW